VNVLKAKEIIKHGVIPGDIDSVDLAEAKGFIEGWQDAVKECAVIAMSHGMRMPSEFMWKQCGGDIAREIISLLEQKP